MSSSLIFALISNCFKSWEVVYIVHEDFTMMILIMDMNFLSFLLLTHIQTVLKSQHNDKAGAMTCVTIHHLLCICMSRQYMAPKYGIIPLKMWNNQQNIGNIYDLSSMQFYKHCKYNNVQAAWCIVSYCIFVQRKF